MFWNLTLAVIPSLEEDHISFLKKRVEYPFPPDEYKIEFLDEYEVKIKKDDCTLKKNGEFDVFLKYHYTDNKASNKILEFIKSREEIQAYNDSLKLIYSYEEFIAKLLNSGWEKWEAKKYNG